MLIIRYTGAEDKAKELRKLLLRPILVPPSASTASRPASQLPSTPASCPASQPPSTPASLPASQLPSAPASGPASQLPSTPESCPASQLPSTPASRPAGQLPSTPASRPASQPPSTPASCPASQLPSTPARTPATCTPVTPSNRYQSTKQLVDLQSKKRSYQSCGRKFASRPLANRMKQQNERFYLLAKEIHHGNKEDLLSGIAHSVSSANNKLKDDSEWDGQLNVQDVVELAKNIHDSRKGKSVYEFLTHDAASEVHHISSLKVLKMQDSISQKETFRTLRKLLPGFIASERRTEQLKYKWHKEFEVVLQPTRTKTGWRINPERLRKCVSFVYPWLKDVDTEWWRLYGDARNFGGQKSVLLSLSVLNDEAMFNGCSFQSPEENCWPIHIFYGPDSRLNLELNIGDGDGYLNTWIDSMAQEGHKTFVASDNMFANAILGGGLDPKSNDNFSIYAFETTSTRSDVGVNTGVRSELKRQIEREHPESLLPAIPTSHFIPCANHMFVRITEHLLTLRVMSCLNEGVVNNDRSGTLSKLMSNINIRGVRGGNFQLKFDGPKLEPVSLNVSHAETISEPPEAFHTAFPHILDGVAQHEQFPQTLSSGLQSALDWPIDTITYYNLEKKIWETHWRMHDPDPRLSESSLLPGSSAGSQNARDYRFGLLESEIEEYIRLADLHHGLMLLRYGSSRLYPYLMTRVDIVPLLLKELPFHSLFRGSTEGGEHCHYLHQCIYYGHSSRGGGWRKEEPILALFKWSYRRLREKIELGEQTREFVKFVKSCFTEVGRDYCKEFGEMQTQIQTDESCGQPMPASTPLASVQPSVPANSEGPVTTEQPAVIPVEYPFDSAVSGESTVSLVTVAPPALHPESNEESSFSNVLPNAQLTVTSADNEESSVTPAVEAGNEYRRGKSVFFTADQSGQVNKGMVIDLTPRKKHVRVATSSKERPVAVALECLTEPPPLPLKNQTFIISGNIAERGEKEKVNTDKLTEIIKNLGGTVFTGDIDKAIDASFMVVTSQKELNKPTTKLNKTLVMACRLGWKIISKKMILEARNRNTLPPVGNYELDLTSIRNAPLTDVVHAKIFTRSTMINNHQVVGGHRELKKQLRSSTKRKGSENKMQEKALRVPKKPCTGYAMFSKHTWRTIIKEHPSFTMREVNALVSEMWKQLTDDNRKAFQQKAVEDFQHRVEQCNSVSRQS